jgi:hypothetical protein
MAMTVQLKIVPKEGRFRSLAVSGNGRFVVSYAGDFHPIYVHETATSRCGCRLTPPDAA